MCAIRSITEDSRHATVQQEQPWRWGASCIPTNINYDTPRGQ